VRTPEISVCVPTYNGSAFLAETLASISSQTVHDYEVVIVDDGSTDGTLRLAEAYAATDARVRVYRNGERAGSSARNANRCLEHARGQWIKFLFQDDLMAPTCLARMLEAGERGRLVVCWHDYLFAPDVPDTTRGYYESLPTLESSLPRTCATIDEFCDAVLTHWCVNFIGPTSSSFIHRDCFAEYGPFSAEITAFPDLEYWIRVGNREGLAIVPERVVTFRVHETSISGGMRREGARQHRRSLDPLLLLLHLARAPEYENIRVRARSRHPAMDPDLMLVHVALDERWSAADARYRQRDPAPLQQWNAFCNRHPDVLEVLQQAYASAPAWTRLKRYLKDRL